MRRHKGQSMHSTGNANGKGNNNSSAADGKGGFASSQGSTGTSRKTRCTRIIGDSTISAETLGQWIPEILIDLFQSIGVIIVSVT